MAFVIFFMVFCVLVWSLWITETRFIRKVEERNEAILKNHELNSKLTKLEDQRAASNLKLKELQNLHDDFLLRHEILLDSYQRSLCQLEEKSNRLMHNESSLRRTIEDNDRLFTLLASKETEFVDQIDRQNKINNNLLTQLIDMDKLNEETLRQLTAAEGKPETRDVECGCD